MLRILTISLFSLSIAGCATSYVAPPGASTAQVKFIADPGPNNNAYFLNVKPGPDCKKTAGQSLARLGSSLNRDGVTEYTRVVESGENIRIFAHWVESYNPYGFTYACKVGAKIDLQSGHKYELRFNISNPCSLHLYELNESGVSSTEQPIINVPVQISKDLCES